MQDDASGWLSQLAEWCRQGAQLCTALAGQLAQMVLANRLLEDGEEDDGYPKKPPLYSDRSERHKKRPAKKPRRKRPVGPLTAKQAEAVHIVGECKGNITEAARRLGKNPTTVRQHYEAAIKKLGKLALAPNPRNRIRV